MRVTIDVPDALGEMAKARAAAEGRTLSALVVDGLQTVLDARAGDEPLPPIPVSEHPMGMLIDITDKDALDDLFNEEGGWI